MKVNNTMVNLLKKLPLSVDAYSSKRRKIIHTHTHTDRSRCRKPKDTFEECQNINENCRVFFKFYGSTAF